MTHRAVPFVVVLAVAVAACTEQFTAAVNCPTFCPGGQVAFADTVLTPVPNGDTSFTGYVEGANLLSVLVSNGGVYGERRGVLRFLPRGDSVLVSDTMRSYTVDSVTIQLGFQARDTTVGNFVLEIYRLPRTVDTSATFATVDALMTPDNLIGELPEPVGFRTGLDHLTLAGSALARLGFIPGDTAILQIGLRVRADGPTATRIGTPASGTLAPVFTSFVTANGVPDSLSATLVTRTSDNLFTVAPPSAPPPSSLLAVGGLPVSRSFIRFVLPPYLRDSATIIRATLQLHADSPVIGIPGDTAVLVASSVLANFGAKSPVVPGVGAVAILLPGDSVVELEVSTLVQLWQGTTPLPSIIRLAMSQEGGTFIFPLFRSTRSLSGEPTLRITYRRPFAFGGL